MRHFERLRITPWTPTFEWVATAEECAIRINSWHEDYPFRVPATEKVISTFRGRPVAEPASGNGRPTPPRIPVGSRLLLEIHRDVFRDKPFAGRWRTLNVTVAGHTPPSLFKVPGLMEELARLTVIRNLEDLQDWYFDMETIHPFEDGNGRTGGIVVATFSHILHPERGWMAANQ